MTDDRKNRLDRPDEHRVPVTGAENTDDLPLDRRGKLALRDDSSQHRRFAWLYEDLLN